MAHYLLPRSIHFIDNVLGIVVAAKERRQDGAVVRCMATSDASRFSLAWFDGVGDLNCTVAVVGPVQCGNAMTMTITINKKCNASSER